MTFSYTFFFGLILLFPGLCAWVALRAVERSDLLTPRPDKPNSTATLFVVVLGTVVGHLAGASAFALQSLWCAATHLCQTVAFDPNVYRIVFAAGHNPGAVSDLAIVSWLFDLAAVGLMSGLTVAALARTAWVRTRWDAMDFGWLSGPVGRVAKGDAVIVAYVVTRTGHDGLSIAYEGIVQQLALDDEQVITMLVLSQVDRFLVRLTDSGVERIDQPGAPIAQMQFHLSEIANVALEVFEDPGAES